MIQTKVRCDICNKEMKRGGLGAHMKGRHGIAGTSQSSEYRRKEALSRYYRVNGKTPRTQKAREAVGWKASQVKLPVNIRDVRHQRKLELQRLLRARQKSSLHDDKEQQLFSAKHDSCPNCGARFYYVV